MIKKYKKRSQRTKKVSVSGRDVLGAFAARQKKAIRTNKSIKIIPKVNRTGSRVRRAGVDVAPGSVAIQKVGINARAGAYSVGKSAGKRADWSAVNSGVVKRKKPSVGRQYKLPGRIRTK